MKSCTDLPPPLGPVPEVVSAAAHQAELHHEDRHPVPAGTVHGVQISTSPQLTPAPSPSSSCLRSLIFLVWPSAACWLELEHLCWLGPAGGWCHHPVTELPGHSGRTTSHNPHSDSAQSADDDMSSAWSTTLAISRMTLS